MSHEKGVFINNFVCSPHDDVYRMRSCSAAHSAYSDLTSRPNHLHSVSASLYGTLAFAANFYAITYTTDIHT